MIFLGSLFLETYEVASRVTITNFFDWKLLEKLKCFAEFTKSPGYEPLAAVQLNIDIQKQNDASEKVSPQNWRNTNLVHPYIRLNLTGGTSTYHLNITLVHEATYFVAQLGGT